MEKIINAAPNPGLTKSGSYYLRPDAMANVSTGAKFLFCLGLLFLPAILSPLDRLPMLLVFAVFILPAVSEFYKLRRNLGQPFMVLETDYFKVGQPARPIAYAAVGYFIFDQSQAAQGKIVFSLFPRKAESIAEIEGKGPVEMKEGQIVCQPAKLDRVTPRAFFEDFGSRLKAAGAVDAMADPEVAAGINGSTGEALIMPKKPLSSWVVRIGAFFNMGSDNLKWISFRLGTLSTVFFVFFVGWMIREFTGWNFDLALMFIFLPLWVIMLMLPVIFAQEILIQALDRVRFIAGFMEKTGEIQKLLLGISVVAGFCLLIALLIRP